MSTTQTTSIIPYSQHYRCFPQMIGSPTNQSVFMYLMDEAMCQLKNGKTASFKISVNEIANKRNMTWRTVTSSLNELQTMKVISVNGDVCTIDTNRFTSLIQAFFNLNKTADKKDFTSALRAGDDDTLVKFGYMLNTQGDSELLSLKGWMQDNVMPNDRGLCHLAEGSAKKQNCSQEVMSFSRTLCHLAEPSAKKQNLNGDIDDQSSAKWQNLMLNSRSKFENISQAIVEQMVKNDFYDMFYPSCIDVMDEKVYQNLVEALFSGECDDFVLLSPEFEYLFMEMVLSFSRSGFCHLAEGVLSFSRTVNKEEIKEKKYGSALAGNIGENKAEEENDIDFSQIDFSRYKLAKEKLSIPFFRADQVESFIEDLRNCIDRSDKIFINQLWEIGGELLNHETADEDGNIQEVPVDLEGKVIYADRIMVDLLTPAYEATEEIVRKGYVVVNGETLKTTTDMIAPDDVQKILDWKMVEINKCMMYEISKRGLHNIFAKTSVGINRRQSTRLTRSQDKEYMRQIILIGEDDKQYHKLTPIELAVYNFLIKYFQISDQGDIEEPRVNFINRLHLSRFYLLISERGVRERDFLSVLFKNRPNTQNGSLTLKERMFDSEAIKHWNEMHSYESVIEV